MTRIRLDPADRKKQMTEAALVIVRGYGVKALTRVALAAETGTTDGLVNRYFGNRVKLRNEIVAEGVKRRDVRVTAWAIREGWPLYDAPRQLRRDAAKLAETLH